MVLWLCSSLWIGAAAIAVVDANSSDSSSGSRGSSTVTDRSLVKLETRSGIRPWVDPDTPEDVRTYVTSRGDTWELIMSDEFGDVNRNFTAGADHLWTSLEMPDGTNDALQLYSHDMTSVVCDDDEEGLCYLRIKSIDEVNNITVWNNYLRPPGFQNSTFYYRSGMLQTWNKFCFQGGMLEVRANLPAVLSGQQQHGHWQGPQRTCRADEVLPNVAGYLAYGEPRPCAVFFVDGPHVAILVQRVQRDCFQFQQPAY